MDKNFVKSTIKEKVFPDGGILHNIAIDYEDLWRLPVDEYGKVHVVMQKRKQMWKYWETHYIYENEYESKKKKEVTRSEKSNVEEDPPF